MAAVALLVMTASTTQKPTTIFIIGDSTAAKKDLSKGSPERGWGMALQCYFDEAFIRVDNHAQNGRSSKDFIDRGLWQKVYEKIQPGDYVIIQFGHNDEKKKDASRYTIPGSTFDANLAKYVNETRERGGIPILMNAGYAGILPVRASRAVTTRRCATPLSRMAARQRRATS